MKQIQLLQITPEELKEVILSGIKLEIDKLKKDIQQKEPDELLTRHETADLLKVDISTVHNYTKRGLLHAHGIGSRVYYKYSEIQGALTRISK